MGNKVPSLVDHTLKLFVYAMFFAGLLIMITAFFSDSESDERGNNKMDSKRRDYTQMELMDQMHRKQLRKIQAWFIETGFGEFYETRDMTPIKENTKKYCLKILISFTHFAIRLICERRVRTISLL